MMHRRGGPGELSRGGSSIEHFLLLFMRDASFSSANNNSPRRDSSIAYQNEQFDYARGPGQKEKNA